jgi:hypothetical protein
MKDFNNEEQEFQRCWDLFWHQETTKEGQKKAWDRLFILVQNACNACCKIKAHGIRIQDLEGKALDATLKVMENIGRGVRPEKISSYVYLFCIGQLWNKKHIEWERSQSFEDIFDNYAVEIDEDRNISLCKSCY